MQLKAARVDEICNYLDDGNDEDFNGNPSLIPPLLIEMEKLLGSQLLSDNFRTITAASCPISASSCLPFPAFPNHFYGSCKLPSAPSGSCMASHGGAFASISLNEEGICASSPPAQVLTESLRTFLYQPQTPLNVLLLHLWHQVGSLRCQHWTQSKVRWHQWQTGFSNESPPGGVQSRWFDAVGAGYWYK